MGRMKEYIIKQLAREPEAAKPTLQEAAKRLLIGFFILMLLLTGVSRAADSVTVAKVTAVKTKSSVLNYIITGTGSIEAKTEKYLELYEGARISEIAVKEGQPIEEGDLLFIYDLQGLETICEDLRRELTIAELNREKEELAQETAASAAAEEEEAAALALRRAELDAGLARTRLEAARSSIDKARQEELEKAEEAYREAEEACMEAERAYQEVQEWKLEAEEDRDRAVLKAEKAYARAEEALKELFAGKRKAEAAIAGYRAAALDSKVKIAAPSQKEDGEPVWDPGSIAFDDREYSATLMNIDNSFHEILTKLYAQSENPVSDTGTADRETPAEDSQDALIRAQLPIFWCYYGEEEYRRHVKTAKALLKELNRAREDYKLAFITAAESGSYLTTAQKAAYIRAYEDAYEAWKEEAGRDKELCDAIASYGAAIQSGSEANAAMAWQSLFSIVYQEDDAKRQVVRSAEELVEVKQEELESTKLQWERKLAGLEKDEDERIQNRNKARESLDKAGENKNKAQEVCDRIKERQYDYGEELQAQESQLHSAERVLEDARTALNKAKKKDSDTLRSNRTKQEINRISNDLLAMEVEQHREAVEAAEKLLKQEGKVLSPCAGKVKNIGVSVGSRITGAEKVSISTENYLFQAKVSREEAEHLEVGDEILLSSSDRREPITAVIESIGREDAQGMAELTAELPSVDHTSLAIYDIGKTVSYTVSKTSGKYAKTLPLQAIRIDSHQMNYVLAIGETNTSLGREQTVYRVNVTVLEKDGKTAAVDTVLGSGDRVVVSSSKSIEEGDRVRINEKNE